jgi:hypothetical protein
MKGWIPALNWSRIAKVQGICLNWIYAPQVYNSYVWAVSCRCGHPSSTRSWRDPSACWELRFRLLCCLTSTNCACWQRTENEWMNLCRPSAWLRLGYAPDPSYGILNCISCFVFVTRTDATRHLMHMLAFDFLMFVRYKFYTFWSTVLLLIVGLISYVLGERTNRAKPLLSWSEVQ